MDIFRMLIFDFIIDLNNDTYKSLDNVKIWM